MLLQTAANYKFSTGQMFSTKFLNQIDNLSMNLF